MPPFVLYGLSSIVLCPSSFFLCPLSFVLCPESYLRLLSISHLVALITRAGFDWDIKHSRLTVLNQRHLLRYEYAITLVPVWSGWAQGLEHAVERALTEDASARLFEPALSTHRVVPASFAHASGSVRSTGSPAGAVRCPAGPARAKPAPASTQINAPDQRSSSKNKNNDPIKKRPPKR